MKNSFYNTIIVAKIIVDDCRKVKQSMILPLSMIFTYHFNIQSMALTRLTTLLDLTKRVFAQAGRT